MADEPTNKGLTAEDAEANRLAAQGNEYGRQEVDVANKSFSLQRLGITDTVKKLQEVKDSVDSEQKTAAESISDAFKKGYASLNEQAKVFSNVGGALKNDFGKFGLALAPLTSIPGVETALTVVKSILAKTFLFMISNEKKKAAMDKLRAMKDRAKAIGGKVVRGAKAVKQNPKAVGKGLFLGLTTAIGVFVKGFISGFQLQLSKILQFLNFKKLGLSLQIKSLKNWSKMTSSIASFGTKLTKILGPLKSVVPTIQKLIKPLQNVLRFVGKFGALLGRFFLPFQIIMGLYKTITGFMDGFKKYEGEGFVTQMFAGVAQGIGDLAGFLIGWPLDFLKSIVTGIGSFFGFDMSMLEDFSFADMFSNLGTFIGDWVASFIDGIKTSIADIGIGGFIGNILLSMAKMAKKIALFAPAVAAGAVRGLAAAWPGGDSPGEAFMKGYNGVINFGDDTIDSFKTQADGMDQDGNVLEQSDATRDAGLPDPTGDTNNAVVQTTVNNTNASKKVYTQRQNRPADDYAYRLAVAQ
jgi:hypothetical protein|tara:strand:+ start:324 stop:1895 length:1572 start_codon:yes stop_codon:yes gene_type:complete